MIIVIQLFIFLLFFFFLFIYPFLPKRKEKGIKIQIDAKTGRTRVKYMCPKCDAIVEENDKKCPHCGSKIR